MGIYGSHSEDRRDRRILWVRRYRGRRWSRREPTVSKVRHLELRKTHLSGRVGFVEDTDGAVAPTAPTHLGRLGGLVAGVGPASAAGLAAQRIKKPNEAMTLKVVGEVQMGELHRKLLNVMIRVAQDEKQPGRRLPPVVRTFPPDELATAREYFWAPLEEFVRDARYDSHDSRLLKQTLEEMQDLRLRSEGVDWLSEVPVPSVRFASEAGKSTWVGFSFAPETRRLVMRPRQYTEILLQMQRQLNSGPAIALYERCRQYLTSPGRKTARAPWSDWYYWLSGQPISKPLPMFKYWKRDTLKRIEAEINLVTDISIRRIEFRVGRQVEDLQYEVFENKQTTLNLAGVPPIDTALRDRLIALKIPAERADRLLTEYDDGLLRANLAYVESEHRRGVIRGKPISYLLAALRDNYAGNLDTAKATIAAARPVSSEDLLRDQFLSDRAAKALELFFELDEPMRLAALEAFLGGSNDLMREQYRRGGLEAPLVRSAFARSFAQATWGDPTTEELLKFANMRLAVQRAAG